MLSKLTTAIIVGLIVIGGASLSRAQQPANPLVTTTPEKQALIAELIEVTGVRKMATELFNSMSEAEEKQLPDLIWQGLSASKEFQSLSKADQNELKKQVLEDSARWRKRMNELLAQKLDL